MDTDVPCKICTQLLEAHHFYANGLSCCFGKLFNRQEADVLLHECEKNIKYFDNNLSEVKVFGKRHKIPRKQCSYGDPGLSYRFSGVTIPALPWPPFLQEIRNRISKIVGWNFNFVLCNRYKDGDDYMGEHKDDEKDLVEDAPIASLSLGFTRDFILRHEATKRKTTVKPSDTENKTIALTTGSLLIMNYPTNKFWYHSIPKRKKVPGVRINLTFRVMKTTKKH